MYFDLQRYLLWGVFLVPSIALMANTSPGYAEDSQPSEFGVKSFEGKMLRGCSSLPVLVSELRNTEASVDKDCVTQDTGNMMVAQETDSSPDTREIEVKKVELINSSFARSPQLQTLIKGVEGQTVSLSKLRDLADQITTWYFEQGYITSRATVDESDIKDGVVLIRVTEGVVEEIRIDPPPKRLSSGYVRSRIAQGLTKPFSQTKLEEQLRLLQTNPLFSKVEGSIRPGSRDGQSVVVIRVTEADPFDASISVDNYSPPSVGSERLGIAAVHRNVTGMGDQFAASYYFSTLNGGSRLYDFSYQVPLNAMDGTLQLRTSISQVKVVQDEFKTLDIRGESLLYEFTYRQPLVRNLREEFALSLGFTVQDGQTFTFAGPTPFGIGPDLDGNSRTRTLKFTQDYVRRDGGGAWGLRSQFNFGLDIFDPTINTDPTIPDARYFSWLLQLQRQQRINQDNVLLAQADLQLSPDGLLPSQQFVIGGGQSVRGYRQNTRAGDNGFRFSLENRLTVARDTNGKELFQIAPFFDMGYIWNKEDNPNVLQKEKFLAGLGLGLLWRPLPDVNVRLDYARPLVEIEDKQNNAQDEGLYFSVGYQL
ncbi:MAG TPA: ShlB/FhaC/HecB family hemolysin secretion/activation protein [Nostocaceae cyanobacterium]|nr:ShlB/FhaC/HecB family hemolysin secretion/activation protein [Nostocaceae cyanobacterium]